MVATYNGGVDKGSPAALILKEGKDEGHDSRAEKDDDELVLELLKNQLPDGGRRFLGNRCGAQRCG